MTVTSDTEGVEHLREGDEELPYGEQHGSIGPYPTGGKVLSKYTKLPRTNIMCSDD